MTTPIRLHPHLSKCKKCSKFECSVTNPYFDPIRIAQWTICFAHWYNCLSYKKNSTRTIYFKFIVILWTSTNCYIH